MEHLHTRRTMLKIGGAAGIAIATGRTLNVAAAQADIDSGGIGLMRADWEAIVGEGTAAGDLVAYPNPERDGFTVLAQFDGSDRVTHLEFGYEEAEAGGLPEEDIRGQITGAMPADAELMETFAITHVNRERTQYWIERYVSEDLGQMSNGLASILVTWQQMDVGFGSGEGAETVVTRVTLTMPGPHTMEAREVGDPGGIGLPREEWIALYGEPEPTQGGDLFANEIVPELQLLVQFMPGDRAQLIDTVALDMMPIVTYADAKSLVGSLLPDDAIMRDTFLMPSTPEGLAALSVEMWECPSLAGAGNEIGSVLAFYEQAVDTNPVTVARVAVALPVMQETATPQA